MAVVSNTKFMLLMFSYDNVNTV